MTRPRQTTRLWIVAAMACGMLAGCASDHDKMMQFLAASHTPVGCEQYRVMPPDTLSINARPTEEFNNYTVKVGPDGKAFLPLIGEYALANKTTSQIAAEVTEALLDYYDDVQVTVKITGYNSQRFYVFGEVSVQGAFRCSGNDTLISALAKARPTRLAQPSKISVIRGLDPLPGEKGVSIDQLGRVKNTSQKVTVNLDDLIQGEGAEANFLLANNDVIYVPPHPLARVGLAIQQVLFPIRPMVTAVGSPQDIVDSAEEGN